MASTTRLLAEKTHNDVEEVERRVFYTLSDNKPEQLHRVTKLVSLLVKHLHEKRHLSAAEIDELLLECADG